LHLGWPEVCWLNLGGPLRPKDWRAVDYVIRGKRAAKEWGENTTIDCHRGAPKDLKKKDREFPGGATAQAVKKGGGKRTGRPGDGSGGFAGGRGRAGRRKSKAR